MEYEKMKLISKLKKGEAIIIQSMYDINDIFVGVAHDEGIAIKGKSRIDLFTGFGYKSEKNAALLNKKIYTWKLVKKKIGESFE